MTRDCLGGCLDDGGANNNQEHNQDQNHNHSPNQDQDLSHSQDLDQDQNGLGRLGRRAYLTMAVPTMISGATLASGLTRATSSNSHDGGTGGDSSDGKTLETAETTGTDSSDPTISHDYDAYLDRTLDHNGLEIGHELDGEGAGTIELRRHVTAPVGTTVHYHEFGGHPRTSNVQTWLDRHTPYDRVEELYSEFWIRFTDDAALTTDGTWRFYWPAYSGGNGASGGGTPNGSNGWSVVTSIAGPERASVEQSESEYELRVGLYHMDRSSDPNETGATFDIHEWTKLGYYWRMNDYPNGVAERNGVIRAYIDGNHVFTRDDIAFANTHGQGCTHIGFTSYGRYEETAGMGYSAAGHRIWLADETPDWARNGSDEPISERETENEPVRAKRPISNSCSIGSSSE